MRLGTDQRAPSSRGPSPYNTLMREGDLLQYVYEQSRSLGGSFGHVTIPPGDDMGAVRLGGQDLLVTVDQVADGIHVDLATTDIARVGRKCITRNLSDVAAMAAKPVGAVMAVSLPRDFGDGRSRALFDAMRTTAEAYECPLIGGDINIWKGPLLVSVTVFAEPAGVEPVLRSGASPGDHLYVTGKLGYSLETGHHLDFEPRLAVARALASQPRTRPTAMIDLSDGLAQDLPRLTGHAMVETQLLPIRHCTGPSDRPAWQHAVGDGEDYELLFAAPPDAGIPRELLGVTVTRIGLVTANGGVRVQLPDDTPAELSGLGWEHHA